MVGILLSALLLYILPQIPCSSAGEISFGLSYNGGKIMTEPVTVSLLWFGTGWQESGKETIRNAITSLTLNGYNEDSDVPRLRDWWDLVRQYTDSSNSPVSERVDVGAECFYTGPHHNMTVDQVVKIGQSVFNKSSIDGFGRELNCTRVFKLNQNSIYHAVFSHTVMFSDGNDQTEIIDSCSGNFQLEVFSGVMVNTSWTRAPQTPTDQCSMFFHGDLYLGPPNGDEKIDSLVGYILAKIAEEVTNQDGRGWMSNDGSGLTVSSSCASPNQSGNDGPPLFRDEERNMSFNAVGSNGYRYILHYIWDQKIRNCALKISETCGASAVVFTQPKGYLKGGIVVNHTDGLQPYPPNQKCLWKIQFPNAKVISFSINYVAVSADSVLLICPSDSGSMQCTPVQSYTDDFDKNFKLMSSKASIEFRSGDHVPFESRGWELSYSAGLCNGKVDVYDHNGVIDYTSSSGFSYVEGLTCQWLLRGKPGTLVSISFTSINISKNLDFLAIYNSTKHQIANFSGFYSGSALPKMNLTGEVMIAFATQTDKGEGWLANFYIASPVDSDKKVFLVIVIAVLAVSISLALVGLAILERRRKHKNMTQSDEGLMLLRLDIEKNENQIGKGPSAIVHKAVSTDGRLVAVKSFRDMAAPTELEEEILFKSSSHPNIISLVGYSQDRIRRRYLVFEFMGRGNLSLNLKERGETLDWEKRITIAMQICSGIQMLHMYLKPPVYHGNITSDNILLDELCNAKLGGFGGANYCKNNQTNAEQEQQLSEMAQDIWSFGLLLIELLRGEPLVNRNTCKKFRSIEEINELVGGQESLDQRLEIPNEKCRIMGLEKLAEIAKWCIGSIRRIEGDDNNAKIGDVLSGLKQVKQLFFCVSG